MKGHVYKRGKAWSYLFDIEPDPLTGKRRQANGSGYRTEREAWKACRVAIAEYEKGRVVTVTKRKVAAAFDEWVTRIEHSVKPSMAQNWRNYAKYYVVPYIGHRDVQEIDGGICDALYAKLLAEGRVKAQPKPIQAKQAVHVRRVDANGKVQACRKRSDSRPADRAEHAGPAEHYPATQGAFSGPRTQDGRQHASNAPPSLGGLRKVGLGQAERRRRRTPAARFP
jgi:hypothetical protein